MKLPKNFGGKGFSGMLQQAQEAMAKAQDIEEELKAQQFIIDKGPVKAAFNGTGEILKISIDPSVVDPNDVEALEDLLVSAVRDGFNAATELRNAKVQQILPNVPGFG